MVDNAIWEEWEQRRQGPPPGGDRSNGAHRPTLAEQLIYFDEITVSSETRDFVEDLLLDGAMSVVYGESNSGKTFWATDLALHVAAGRPYCGREVDQGGVIYCALEGAQGVENRIVAWRNEHMVNGHATDFIPFAVLRSSLNLLDPEADTAPLIKLITDQVARMTVRVRLVVIDTLFRALSGGNENASEDMGLLVVNADRIRRETGAHVMFIHHSGKDTAKGARGHSSLRAATDTEIEVTDQDGDRTATVNKQRDLPNEGAFSFTLATVELATNRRGKPVTSCIVSHDQPKPGRKRAPKVTGHSKRALDILANVLAEQGAINPETHINIPSIGEQFWRDRFYREALPGAPADTKKRTFRRAADHLIEIRRVGMSAGLVWITREQED